MHQVSQSDETNNMSILQTILAANYDEYTEQRFQLRYVFDNSEQFAQYRDPPAKKPAQRPAERPADRPHLTPRGPRRK
jgi:non-canonical poly(A) RNA polymerase PAPD5/7